MLRWHVLMEEGESIMYGVQHIRQSKQILLAIIYCNIVTCTVYVKWEQIKMAVCHLVRECVLHCKSRSVVLVKANFYKVLQSLATPSDQIYVVKVQCFPNCLYLSFLQRVVESSRLVFLKSNQVHVFFLKEWSLACSVILTQTQGILCYCYLLSFVNSQSKYNWL